MSLATSFESGPCTCGQHLQARSTTLDARSKWRRLFRIVARAVERMDERRVLAALDDRMLNDIGVTRHEALAEAAKPIWR